MNIKSTTTRISFRVWKNLLYNKNLSKLDIQLILYLLLNGNETPLSFDKIGVDLRTNGEKIRMSVETLIREGIVEIIEKKPSTQILKVLMW